jgi:uncharacterized membrane protein
LYSVEALAAAIPNHTTHGTEMLSTNTTTMPAGNPLPAGICMQRNCSASPQLLAGVLGTLALISLTFGLVFLALGTPWILVYALNLTACLTGVFFHYARHAADRETIILTDHTVEICQELGSRQLTAIFARAQVRIALHEHRHDGVEISNGVQTVGLGSLLSPSARRELHAVLSKNLRSASPHQCTTHIHNVLSASGVCRLSLVQ